MYQKTIKKSISCSGVGVHSGASMSITLHPAPANSGILFKRTDGVIGDRLIPARWDHVVSTNMCTTIGNKDGVTIATIEHLMAAFYALGVDNVLVEVEGPEIPIMDGSAAPFIFLIECVGLEVQNALRAYIKIQDTIEFNGTDGQYIRLTPAPRLSLEVMIDFNGRGNLAPQTYGIDNLEFQFKSEIARSRTYGFYEDAQKLWAAGMSQGASLDNTVVFDKGEVMNKEGMRYNNECVRHKVLDAVGDLYLAGYPIQGHYQAKNCGHFLNNAILKKLFQEKNRWELITYPAQSTHKATEGAFEEVPVVSIPLPPKAALA